MLQVKSGPLAGVYRALFVFTEWTKPNFHFSASDLNPSKISYLPENVPSFSMVYNLKLSNSHTSFLTTVTIETVKSENFSSEKQHFSVFNRTRTRLGQSTENVGLWG